MRLLCVALAALSVSLVGWDRSYAQTSGSDRPVVAVFALDGQISESPRGDEFPFGSVGGGSLKDLIARMKKTKDDDQVQAVVLLPGSAALGLAQMGTS